MRVVTVVAGCVLLALSYAFIVWRVDRNTVSLLSLSEYAQTLANYPDPRCHELVLENTAKVDAIMEALEIPTPEPIHP